MAHRAPQDHQRGLRLALPGPRTRLIVAVVCGLLSVGAPVMLLGIPGLIADGRPADPPPAGRSPDDPAGLGITGALPGDPLPDGGLPATGVPDAGASGDAVPGDGASDDGAPGDSGGAGPPGLITAPDLPDGPLGIPGVVLSAYQSAERTLVATRPGCHLSWSVLAGIGRIESGHARSGRVDAAGNTLGPILGPPLNGSPGVAAIADTDRGVLDHDTVWDRAVGPMQFIPTSWRGFGADGNGDGVASPHNIYDATVAAGRYLCSGDGDLADPAQLQAAVFRYNHSAAYVTVVLRWAQAYLSGVVPTPPAPGPIPPGTNGNGGVAILASGAPQTAAAPALVAQPVPSVTPPPATTSPPPPVTTTPPAMTAPPEATTAPPGATPAPPATTTAPPGATPAPPATTTAPPGATPAPLETPTPPATDSSPPPPAATTTPVEPTSPPPPAAP